MFLEAADEELQKPNTKIGNFGNKEMEEPKRITYYIFLSLFTFYKNVKAKNTWFELEELEHPSILSFIIWFDFNKHIFRMNDNWPWYQNYP